MEVFLVVSLLAAITTVTRGQGAAPAGEFEYEYGEGITTTLSTTSTTRKTTKQPPYRYPPYRPPVRPPYVPGRPYVPYHRPYGPPITFATWNPQASIKPVTGNVRIYQTPPANQYATPAPSPQAAQPYKPPMQHPGRAAAGPAGPAGPYVPPAPTRPPTTPRRPGQIGLKISGGITTPPPPPQGSCPKFTHHISGNKIVIETVPGRCQMLLSWLPLTAEQQKRMNIISAGLASVLYKETKPRTLG